ncbi:phage terminase small subunit P27 family [Companilactobacillus kedongensis]|uniref:phage terminase small subunit P27 family n=1 Tax=Companilactobacillus kedongensis TaxID=2486004 RepID=UPI000F774465|nr:phage terminase small subunit P27 family [Companilactobacillus kedongensis]
MPQNAKSALIHIYEGNPNNKSKKELYKRKNNEEKLSLPNDDLNPPTWLTATGAKEFNRIVSMMEPTKLLTNGDVNTLALYCDTLADYRSYSRKIKQKGVMMKGRVNPFIREKRNAAQLLDKLANELGLTPGSRASLAINMDSGEDEDEDFE